MKITEYVKETKGELAHVNWPTRKQAVFYTAIVVGISLVFSVFLGAFDFLFTLGLEWIIK